jgi:hypothetical protein
MNKTSLLKIIDAGEAHISLRTNLYHKGKKTHFVYIDKLEFLLSTGLASIEKMTRLRKLVE